LVLDGMPFRDAYKQVGEDIANGNFSIPKSINHTHEGSIGNLCNSEIKKNMEEVVRSFNFEKIHEAFEKLVN
jgi:argininosuccinate lyase